MREQYTLYGLATDVFLLLSQGEEGDQGPIGEVGAQGPPVNYFLLNSIFCFIMTYLFSSYYKISGSIKSPHLFLFILPYCLSVAVELLKSLQNAVLLLDTKL